MHILFDHQAFSMQTFGGVSNCFAQLIANLPSDVKALISIKDSDNIYLKQTGIAEAGKLRNASNFIVNRSFKGQYRLHQLLSYISPVWSSDIRNKKCSINALSSGKFDVFHPTFFDDYFLPYLKGKPFVLTIHDMIPELYPQYFAKDDRQIIMKRKLAPLANAIIAVSEHTKKDIIRILGVKEEKVHVVYNGCSFPDKSEVIIHYQDPYILYVGERWGYKNFNLFLDNITPVLQEYSDLKIVCTGRPFSSEEIQKLRDLNIYMRFVHHMAKSDEELFALYHHAMCFVYPSEYEGFGIPILEAYKADCPIFLNHASCFPEIAGDAAIYFTMTKDYSDLAPKLISFLKTSSSDRESLLLKQRIRLKRYSWADSSKNLCNIYRSL